MAEMRVASRAVLRVDVFILMDEEVEEVMWVW